MKKVHVTVAAANVVNGASTADRVKAMKKMSPWMTAALIAAVVFLIASPINAWATFLLIPAWRNLKSALADRDTATLNDGTYHSLRSGIFWLVLGIMFMFSAFSFWPLAGGWLASKFIFNRWKERTFSPIVE